MVSLLQTAYAFDYSKDIFDTDLPFNTTQNFIIHAKEDSTLYFNPSTSWLRVNQTYFFKDVTQMTIPIQIVIPNNIPTGSYDESVVITTNYNTTSELSFHFNILLNETRVAYLTDLTIEIKDFFNNDLIEDVGLILRKDNTTYTGKTDSAGRYVFEDIERRNWDLYMSKPGYITDSRVVAVRDLKESRTFYVTNSSVNWNDLTDAEYLEFLYKQIDINTEYIESLKRTEPEMIYVNQTVYQSIPYNKEAFDEFYRCNPQTIADLEDGWDLCEKQVDNLNQRNNQLIVENQQIQSEIFKSNDAHKDEIEEMKLNFKIKTTWIILVIVGVFIATGVGILLYFYKSDIMEVFDK